MRLCVLTKLFTRKKKILPKFQWKLYHLHHKGENNTCTRSSVSVFTVHGTEEVVLNLIVLRNTLSKPERITVARVSPSYKIKHGQFLAVYHNHLDPNRYHLFVPFEVYRSQSAVG